MRKEAPLVDPPLKGADFDLASACDLGDVLAGEDFSHGILAEVARDRRFLAWAGGACHPPACARRLHACRQPPESSRARLRFRGLNGLARDPTTLDGIREPPRTCTRGGGSASGVPGASEPRCREF